MHVHTPLSEQSAGQDPKFITERLNGQGKGEHFPLTLGVDEIERLGVMVADSVALALCVFVGVHADGLELVEEVEDGV